MSGCASKRQIPGSAQARSRVPKPTAKLPVFRAPAPPSRKQQAEILKDTKQYEREQYIRTGPLPDGSAERAEAQLLFEHGRKRLQEMKTLEQERREQAAAHVAREPDSQEIREALVQQVQTLTQLLCLYLCASSHVGSICTQAPCQARGNCCAVFTANILLRARPDKGTQES